MFRSRKDLSGYMSIGHERDTQAFFLNRVPCLPLLMKSQLLPLSAQRLIVALHYCGWHSARQACISMIAPWTTVKLDWADELIEFVKISNNY